MRAATAFACGALFALGLALSGMTDPNKIVAFLDVGGRWDPSLALVMAGAIGVYLPVYAVVRRRPRPLLDDTFHVRTDARVDGRLIAGAAIFGIGWGAAGYCPGPALVSLTSGRGPLLFSLGLLVGLVGFDRVRRLSGGAP